MITTDTKAELYDKIITYVESRLNRMEQHYKDSRGSHMEQYFEGEYLALKDIWFQDLINQDELDLLDQKQDNKMIA